MLNHQSNVPVHIEMQQNAVSVQVNTTFGRYDSLSKSRVMPFLQLYPYPIHTVLWQFQDLLSEGTVRQVSQDPLIVNTEPEYDILKPKMTLHGATFCCWRT